MKSSKKIGISVKTLLFCLIAVICIFYIRFNVIDKKNSVAVNSKALNSVKNIEEYVEQDENKELIANEYEIIVMDDNLSENNENNANNENNEKNEIEQVDEELSSKLLEQVAEEIAEQQENQNVVSDSDINLETKKTESLTELVNLEPEQEVKNEEILPENSSQEFVLEDNISWKITQYGDNVGAQMMNFSIEGNNHGLVLIDGGYENSTEQVEYIKTLIKKHNNKVDAWIITHLDSDHAGVFNYIYKNCPEVQINKIYTTNIPNLELAKEKAKWENDWKTYEDFCGFNLKNIQYLSEGDNIENLIGLRMKVLWAYSDWVYNNSTNLLNNGSLVFKLFGKEENILFCADTQDIKVCNQIIEKYKGILKSDYLQVGHHGNNSFSDEFYEIVSPKVALFCAPDWLMNNEGNVSWFTVGKIRDLLRNKGTQIVSYNTSPNIINIK